MRTLTLDERITVQNSLKERGISIQLEDIDTRSALYWWNIASSTPLSSII